MMKHIQIEFNRGNRNYDLTGWVFRQYCRNYSPVCRISVFSNKGTESLIVKSVMAFSFSEKNNAKVVNDDWRFNAASGCDSYDIEERLFYHIIAKICKLLFSGYLTYT